MKDKRWAVFILCLVVIFLTSNYLLTIRDPSHIVHIEKMQTSKVCIMKKTKVGRDYVYNDSIMVGPYYRDYDNRLRLDRTLNCLYPKLSIGNCLLLGDNPNDSLYLIEGNDTTLYVNLYPKDEW